MWYIYVCRNERQEHCRNDVTSSHDKKLNSNKLKMHGFSTTCTELLVAYN